MDCCRKFIEKNYVIKIELLMKIKDILLQFNTVDGGYTIENMQNGFQETHVELSYGLH